MLDVTKLYCNKSSTADGLRYGLESKNKPDSFKTESSAAKRKPIVVWNITRRCNLACKHCYSNSENRQYPDELTTKEAYKVVDELAEYGIPVLLFSGGEPLMRADLFEVAGYAKSRGLRIVLSTNGTMIDKNVAEKIKNLGFSYVGISLDGIGEVNDEFRGKKGAFDKTIKAFKYLKDVNQRTGLRMTLTNHNIDDLENIFNFITNENINRVCFYHLVNSGRGKSAQDITHNQTRKALDKILAYSKNAVQSGQNVEILTVDNHVDNVYLYLKLLQEDKTRASEVYKILEWNGGGLYSSGIGIGAIDPEGNVHPDQFWQHYNLGNIRNRPFSEIWNDTSNPLMGGLKNKKLFLKGKCSNCNWLNICGGALRVRSDLLYNDPWQPDPACYLTDNELLLNEPL